jgi:hypothetical protein
MACETGVWASVLPDNEEPDDGTLFIDQVHGSGEIEGRYRKKDAPPPDEDIQNGTCVNDKIDFDIVGFHYEGKIKGRIIKGKKKTKPKDKKEFDGEEVWVGVKTA